MTASGRKSKSSSLSNPTLQGGRPRLEFGSDDEKRWHKNEIKRKCVAKSKGKAYKIRPYPGSGVTGKIISDVGTAGEGSPEDIIASPEDTISSSDQMIEDMREVYRAMGGAKALLKRMKGDPKFYALTVQNLMKVEAGIQEAQLKKGGGDDAKGVFVVLKGLSEDDRCPHCGKGVNEPISTTDDVKDTTGGVKITTETIDLSSMTSILNPGAEVIREGGDW